MPSSVEHYVQEVGRAGRDGAPARCTLLLSDADFVRQHSLAHAEGVECSQLRRLLAQVFDRRRWALLPLRASRDGAADGAAAGGGDDARGASTAVMCEAAAAALDMKVGNGASVTTTAWEPV